MTRLALGRITGSDISALFPPQSDQSQAGWLAGWLAVWIQTKQVKGKSLEILLIVENDPVMDTFVGNKLGQNYSN